MNEYVGQICPHCGTMITEGQSVAVCTACGTVHHENCWNYYRGCANTYCSMHPQPAAAPVNTTPICTSCGTVLQSGQNVCHACGAAQSVQNTQSVPSQTGVYGANMNYTAPVQKKPKKKKLLAIILAAVLALAVGVGFIVSNVIAEQKAEEAYEEYMDNAQKFMDLSLTAGVNLENIADTVIEYWYDCIWYDWYNEDIDTAIYYALLACSSEIDTAESYHSQMTKLYNQLKTIPKEVAEEDRDELEEIRDVVKALYAVYGEYYTLATDPYGSYNSYTANQSEFTDDFLKYYEDLEELLD